MVKMRGRLILHYPIDYTVHIYSAVVSQDVPCLEWDTSESFFLVTIQLSFQVRWLGPLRKGPDQSDTVFSSVHFRPLWHTEHIYEGHSVLVVMILHP